MIWQNPWAWIGLLTIVLPILIHLMGQGRARRQLFPTLRFFGATRPLPTSRTRLHDLLLLAIRIAILVAAVAALARPLVLNAARRGNADNSIVRAIIIDNSGSMERLATPSLNALTLAERMAQQLADSSTSRVMLPAESPSGAIAGAVEWLLRQPGRRELAIASDFQVGAIDERDLAHVPNSIGIRLLKVPTQPAAGTMDLHLRQGESEILSRTTISPQSTQVDWRSTGALTSGNGARMIALTGPDESSGAANAARAASTLAVTLPLDTMAAIAIVYPSAPERAGIVKGITPLHTRWMVDLVAQLHDNTILAGEGNVKGRDRLVLLPAESAGSTASATLIAGVTRALSLAVPVGELEPNTIDESTLQRWERATPGAGTVDSSATNDESDGRWLWVIVLLLLAVETVIRRTIPHAD